MINALFFTSSLLVIMAPGPDAALVVHLVMSTARRGPALAAAGGMVTAGACHAALAVTGVSLVLSAVPDLFTAVRWGGALVLLVWGARALRGAARRHRSGGRDPDALASAPPSLQRCFARGVLCTGTNPKVGLFLVAFLPQFTSPGAPPARSTAVLAALYLAMAAAWLTLLCWLLHALRRRLHTRRPGEDHRLLQVVDLVVGSVLVGFAVRLGLGG